MLSDTNSGLNFNWKLSKLNFNYYPLLELNKLYKDKISFEPVNKNVISSDVNESILYTLMVIDILNY